MLCFLFRFLIVDSGLEGIIYPAAESAPPENYDVKVFGFQEGC